MANQSKDAAIAIIKEIIASANESATVARSLEADIRKPPTPPVQPAVRERSQVFTPTPPTTVTSAAVPAMEPPRPAPPVAKLAQAAPVAEERKDVSEPAKDEVKSASQSEVLALISGGAMPSGPKKG